MPVKMERVQAVAIGDQVYVGGGDNTDNVDLSAVLKYHTVKDEWTRLSEHCVCYYSLCHFQAELLTVGGVSCDEPTNKVYRYSTADRKWVESLKPMVTKRAWPALLTTASAIVVCGGDGGESGGPVALDTVEVYSSTTSQWHTANPLPQPCFFMSFITISGSGFLLGGMDTNHGALSSLFCVDMATLIDRATSPTRHHDTTSPWKTLPDTPLTFSAAATLSGGLLAVGGDDDNEQTQSTVHVFVPSTNSWVKLPSGDLPAERTATTTVLLSNNRVMVMGGEDNDEKVTSTCYIGSVVV